MADGPATNPTLQAIAQHTTGWQVYDTFAVMKVGQYPMRLSSDSIYSCKSQPVMYHQASFGDADFVFMLMYHDTFTPAVPHVFSFYSLSSLFSLL